MRAVGEHIEFNKNTETQVYRENLCLFMSKRGEISIRKWKIVISNLQIVIRRTLKITLPDWSIQKNFIFVVVSKRIIYDCRGIS